LVVYVHSYSLGSLGDGAGNTWTLVTNANCGTGTGGARYISIYYAANCAGGSYSVSTSGTGSTYSLQVLEFSGAATANPVHSVSVTNDQTAPAPAPFTCSVGPITLVSTNELIIAGYADSSGAPAAGAGYSAPTGYSGMLEYRIGALTLTNVTATVTNTGPINAGGDPYGMIAVSFKPAN
jgi:hypothetical protein